MKPHKHAELIKAWADGALLQYKNLMGEWKDVLDNNPGWFPHDEYRIKPEPKPDVVKYFIQLDADDEYRRYGFMGSTIQWVDEQGKQVTQVKIIWDGETKKLKSAEVLK